MTLKEKVLIVAIIALLLFGLTFGPETKAFGTGPANDDDGDAAVKEFVKEMCAMEGMIRIKFEGVNYECKDVRKWK